MTLVPLEKILLSPLYIKSALIKQLLYSLPKNGERFTYLCSNFPKLSEAKLKEDVFINPDLRKPLSNPLFSEIMEKKKHGTTSKM